MDIPDRIDDVKYDPMENIVKIRKDEGRQVYEENDFVKEIIDKDNEFRKRFEDEIEGGSLISVDQRTDQSQIAGDKATLTSGLNDSLKGVQNFKEESHQSAPTETGLNTKTKAKGVREVKLKNQNEIAIKPAQANDQIARQVKDSEVIIVDIAKPKLPPRENKAVMEIKKGYDLR